MKSDIRFTNLEVTIHNFDVYPSAMSGGDWTAARPAALQDLKWIGFDMMAWANNHTLDWSHGGLLATYGYLEKEQIVHAGVGRNLSEAAAPKYYETAHGRVALIAATSTCKDWHIAGEQRRDLLGRPGVNPLRFRVVHRITSEEMDRLKGIARHTEINAPQYFNEIEGFSSSKAEFFHFGQHLFEVGEPGSSTMMSSTDAARIEQSIREAARQADIVLVSHHVHEAKGVDKAQPPDFQKQFARMCIDSGAHAYIGHGPHILRGIEVYENRPIFYSLGDFLRQSELLDLQPTEFFEIYGLEPFHNTADGFDRKNLAPAGIRWDSKAFESVIASLEFDHGSIRQITLHPIELAMNKPRSRRGLPNLAASKEGEAILQGLQELSAPFGTHISIHDGVGTIRWEEL